MEIHPQDGVQPISDFRKNSSLILKRLTENHAPILLTQRGRSVAVLLDIETFEEMEYAAKLRSSYVRGIEDLKAGKSRSFQDVKKEIEARTKM